MEFETMENSDLVPQTPPMESPESLPRTPLNPQRRPKKRPQIMSPPTSGDLAPPPASYAEGFTSKRLAKGFASLLDDEKEENEETSTNKPKAPLLLSPIQSKDDCEQEPAKINVAAKFKNRLVGESNTLNKKSSYRDTWTQTEDLEPSVKDAETQTGDAFHTAEETLPSPPSTKSSDTQTVVEEESNDCADDSSETSVSDSTEASLEQPIAATEDNSVMKTDETDTVMKDVGDAGELTDTKLGEEEAKALLKKQWLGTSKCAIQLHQECQLEGLIAFRQTLIKHLSEFPYNPTFYADLAAVHNKIGFTDIGTANAYKAILLAECALSDSTTRYPGLPYLRTEVLNVMRAKHFTNSLLQINRELHYVRAYAYRELLYGLMYCGAYWEGLTVAKKALALYPNDATIKGLAYELKEGFKDRCNILAKTKIDRKEQATYAKRGAIYTVKYPWMDEKLFYRTPEMLRQVNENLASSSCEVRRVVFGKDPEQKLKEISEGMDIGALGSFATKDIKKGEMILVDPTLLGISNVNPSKRHHCDACQSFLVFPYLHPSEMVYPKCCKTVAYCSLKCRDDAAGMHSLLCGKNIDYLYKGVKVVSNPEKQDDGYLPRSILAARTMAVIFADTKKTGTHPLQHNLAARLVANYSPVGTPCEQKFSYYWHFKQCVVNPTKFLLQLGVDIFRSRDWDPEVIQTLAWRLENNANMAISTVFPPQETQFVDQAKREGIDMVVNSSNINPNYLFFNHSCLFNVLWDSSTECNEDIGSIEGMEGKLLRPGTSAVRCYAARDIKKGEELTISYVGEAGVGKGGKERKACRIHLEKWFKGGCGCAVCEEENKKAAEEGKNVMADSKDEDMDLVGYDI